MVVKKIIKRFSVRGKDKITQELGFVLMALNLRKWRKNKKEIRQKTRKNKYSKMRHLIFEYLFSLKETFGSASFRFYLWLYFVKSMPLASHQVLFSPESSNGTCFKSAVVFAPTSVYKEMSSCCHC